MTDRPAGSPAAGQVDADPAALFAAPPPGSGPWTRWWWPGGDVDPDRLAADLADLHAAGFAGVEIQPFGYGVPADLPADRLAHVDAVFDDRFHATLRSVLDRAEALGLRVDLNFGSGWPLGGPWMPPARASRQLAWSLTSVSGPSRRSLHLPRPLPAAGVTRTYMSEGVRHAPTPAEQEAHKDVSRDVAVIAIRGQAPLVADDGVRVWESGQLEPGTALDLTGCLSGDCLNWDVPEGQWHVFRFAQLPADAIVDGGVGAGPKFVADHLDPAAVALHIAAVGDRLLAPLGHHVGRTLRAIFLDSMELDGAHLLWTDRFPAEFAERRGYALERLLPFVPMPGFNSRSARLPRPEPLNRMACGGDAAVRRDFQRTVSDLLVDACYAPLRRWANAQGLLLRAQPYGEHVDPLATAAEVDLPEAEELFARGNPDFLRMIASAAAQAGLRLVTSESLVKAAIAFDTSPADICLSVERQFCAGITGFFYHGVPCTAPAYRLVQDWTDCDWPGWYPFAAPTSFGSWLHPRNPIWRVLDRVNRGVARLQLVGQASDMVAPVAILRSRPEFSANPAPVERHKTALLEAGVSYHHIAPARFLACRLENGVLYAAAGAAYRLLVVEDRMLGPDVAERLAELAEQGFPILLRALPQQSDSWQDWDSGCRRVQAAMDRVLAAGGRLVADDRLLAQTAATLAPSGFRLSGSPMPSWIERSSGGRRFLFLLNDGDSAGSWELSVRGAGAIERWDPASGSIDLLDDSDSDGTGCAAPLRLAPGQSCLLSWQTGSAARPGARSVPLQPCPAAFGPWTAALSGRDGCGRRVERDFVAWDPAGPDSLLPDDFSGTLVLETVLDVPAPEAGCRIDFGDLADAVEIIINDHTVDRLVRAPWALEIGPYLRPGRNLLRLALVTTPYNALRQAEAGADGVALHPRAKGLFGPVTLWSRSTAEAVDEADPL